MAQIKPSLCAPSAKNYIFLRSSAGYHGNYSWQLIRSKDAGSKGEEISTSSYQTKNWQPAIVPGTVLNSLVANKKYPDPYFGDHNRRSRKLIPDLADEGQEFYHYWFRTAFYLPKNFTGKHIWMKFHGINYRCTIWVNGKNLGKMAGMFNTQSYDISKVVNLKGKNVMAVDVLPVDVPGSYYKPGQGRSGAVGENHNGGDGEIGRNVTMLMSVGWDFTSPDGIRDRNTGIWRDVELYTTGDVVLEHPFVKTDLPLPDTSSSRQIISVELNNTTARTQKGVLSGKIIEGKVSFQKSITLQANEKKTIVFTPDEYKQLTIKHPRLWWPIFKGNQNLYTLSLKFTNKKKEISHVLTARFGIREVSSDQNTPDQSRRFYVNGQPIFVRGTNWVPEAMLRNSELRTYAELRYTKQAGINFIRLWGGGIAESDYFYQLCDEFGFLVWNEFWLTGDTRFPTDTALYFKNVVSTIKRIRNHPSLAYYVAANEAKEIAGTAQMIHRLDPTRGYQEQSECCGVHDGSPYKYENPMQYFENTASQRGSRVDGFNPEYGTPCLPILESLRKMMPKKDLWPVNDSVWNYLDGNGFHQMTTKYRQAVNQFGQSSSIEEYAKKAQFVGAMNYRSIWEVWNYNKFGYGDRYASGYLFWYHNSPLPQTASRLYDWFLEPTAALYYSQNGLAPLHPQFDYLKNTVSVYNDYRVAFAGYRVEATVYDMNGKARFTQSTKVNIPADGLVKDALKIVFPNDITNVHFIKLKLINKAGKIIADTFYWRSKAKYNGAWTLTGPAISGFEDINKMAKVNLNVKVEKQMVKGIGYLHAKITNPSSVLAFFIQLKLQDNRGNNMAPSYYSDNFFSLLPGESKEVTIEMPSIKPKGKLQLVTDGWNSNINKNEIYN
jgi:mannosylglycoprotein endo-beta-mannosidase